MPAKGQICSYLHVSDLQKVTEVAGFRKAPMEASRGVIVQKSGSGMPSSAIWRDNTAACDTTASHGGGARPLTTWPQPTMPHRDHPYHKSPYRNHGHHGPARHAGDHGRREGRENRADHAACPANDGKHGPPGDHQGDAPVKHGPAACHASDSKHGQARGAARESTSHAARGGHDNETSVPGRQRDEGSGQWQGELMRRRVEMKRDEAGGRMGGRFGEFDPRRLGSARSAPQGGGYDGNKRDGSHCKRVTPPHAVAQQPAVPIARRIDIGTAPVRPDAHAGAGGAQAGRVGLQEGRPAVERNTDWDKWETPRVKRKWGDEDDEDEDAGGGGGGGGGGALLRAGSVSCGGAPATRDPQVLASPCPSVGAPRDVSDAFALDADQGGGSGGGDGSSGGDGGDKSGGGGGVGARKATGDPFDPVTDPQRLSQRQKQIDYGKNTIAYARYLKEVPRHHRRRSDPATPDKSRGISKRCFDGLVRAWRRKLHQWDEPGAPVPPHLADDLTHSRSPNIDAPGSTDGGGCKYYEEPVVLRPPGKRRQVAGPGAKETPAGSSGADEDVDVPVAGVPGGVASRGKPVGSSRDGMAQPKGSHDARINSMHATATKLGMLASPPGMAPNGQPSPPVGSNEAKAPATTTLSIFDDWDMDEEATAMEWDENDVNVD
eukprot:jgi/Mesvir1/2119/Mv16647-RA.1